MKNIKFCRQLKVIADQVRGDADIETASGRADALLALMGLTSFADATPASSPAACSSVSPSPAR